MDGWMDDSTVLATVTQMDRVALADQQQRQQKQHQPKLISRQLFAPQVGGTVQSSSLPLFLMFSSHFV